MDQKRQGHPSPSRIPERLTNPAPIRTEVRIQVSPIRESPTYAQHTARQILRDGSPWGSLLKLQDGVLSLAATKEPSGVGHAAFSQLE